MFRTPDADHRGAAPALVGAIGRDVVCLGAAWGAESFLLFSSHSQIISGVWFPTGYGCGTTRVLEGHSKIVTPVATSQSDPAMSVTGVRAAATFEPARSDGPTNSRADQQRADHAARNAQPSRHGLALCDRCPYQNATATPLNRLNDRNTTSIDSFLT